MQELSDAALQDAVEAKMMALKLSLEDRYTSYTLHSIMQLTEDIWGLMLEQERRGVFNKQNTRQ